MPRNCTKRLPVEPQPSAQSQTDLMPLLGPLMASSKPLPGAPQRFVRSSPDLRDSRDFGPRNFRRGGVIAVQLYAFTGRKRLSPRPPRPRAPTGHARPSPNRQITLVIKIRAYFAPELRMNEIIGAIDVRTSAAGTA